MRLVYHQVRFSRLVDRKPRRPPQGRAWRKDVVVIADDDVAQLGGVDLQFEGADLVLLAEVTEGAGLQLSFSGQQVDHAVAGQFLVVVAGILAIVRGADRLVLEAELAFRRHGERSQPGAPLPETLHRVLRHLVLAVFRRDITDGLAAPQRLLQHRVQDAHRLAEPGRRLDQHAAPFRHADPDLLHQFHLPRARRCKRELEIRCDLAPPLGALCRLCRFQHQFVQTQFQPFPVTGEVEGDGQIVGLAVSRGDQVESQARDDPVFKPVAVAVGQQLQGVRLVQGPPCQPALQFPQVEAALDLLYLRGIMTENPVHAPVDLEAEPAPLEKPPHRHLGLVERIHLGPFLLHPDMDLLSVQGSASIAGTGLDASGARHREGELADWDGDEICRWFHMRGVFLAAALLSSLIYRHFPPTALLLSSQEIARPLQWPRKRVSCCLRNH